MAKKKMFNVALESEVAIEPYSWDFKRQAGETLGGNGKKMTVLVEASSGDEAIQLAKKSVEGDFPQTVGKLTSIKKPSVPTTSKKYVDKKGGAI